MTLKNRHVAMVAVTSLASAGIVAAPAVAAPSKVAGGRTTLTITAKGAKTLKRHHVKLSARKPGTAKGRSYALPVKTGTFDFGSNRGSVTQSGTLRLKHGRRTVAISGLTVTIAKNSKVVAKVGGRKLTLGTFSASKKKVKSSAANRSVGNLRFKFSAKAAKRINSKLKTRKLKLRSVTGAITVRVHKPLAASPAPTTAVPNTSTGEAKIGFAPAASAALAQAGLSPSALPGSEALPDGSFSFPVTAADIDPQSGSGTVDLGGGFTLGSGADSATIDHPQLVLGTADQGLYASVNGLRVKLADLDKAGLSDALKSGTKQLSDLLLTLSPEGAAALNQAGGISLFVPGTPLGDLDVTLPSS